MAISSSSALEMAESDTNKTSNFSKPLVKDPTTEFLIEASRQADEDTSESSESNRPVIKDATAEWLKHLSRQAESSSDDSVECDYCGPNGSGPPAEYHEGMSTNADIETNSSSEASRPRKKGASGEYLEGLSRQILNVCLNLKDPHHPIIYKHQSADFRNKHDALPKAANRKDHHANLAKHLQEQKNFHIEIFNTSSEVDESRGRATIYLWYEITGLTHGIEREAIAVLSWERKQGTWLLMKHIGMRGPAGFC